MLSRFNSPIPFAYKKSPDCDQSRTQQDVHCVEIYTLGSEREQAENVRSCCLFRRFRRLSTECGGLLRQCHIFQYLAGRIRTAERIWTIQNCLCPAACE